MEENRSAYIGLKTKTIWIRVDGFTTSNSIRFSYLYIYRKDGSFVYSSNVRSIRIFRKMPGDSEYTISSATISSIYGSGYTSGSGIEIGIVIDLYSEIELGTISIKLKPTASSYGSPYVNISTVKNYGEPDYNISDYRIFFTEYTYLSNYYDSTVTSESKLLKQYDTPSVTLDDENNKIIGINGNMEYSIDNQKSWSKFYGPNPNLENTNRKIYVRNSADYYSDSSNPVELSFTSPVKSNYIKRMWINIVSDTPNTGIIFNLVKIYRTDGSILSREDILTVDISKRDNNTSDQTIYSGYINYFFSSSTASVTSNREIGVILNFVNYEDIYKVELTFNSLGQQYNKLVDVYLYSVNESVASSKVHEGATEISNIKDFILIYKLYKYFCASIAIKNKNSTPDIKFDKNKNEIVGLNDSTEFSFGGNSWSRDNNLFNIFNKNTNVFIRSFGNDNLMHSNCYMFNIKPPNMTNKIFLNFNSPDGYDIKTRITNMRIITSSGKCINPDDIKFGSDYYFRNDGRYSVDVMSKSTISKFINSNNDDSLSLGASISDINNKQTLRSNHFIALSFKHYIDIDYIDIYMLDKYKCEKKDIVVSVYSSEYYDFDPYSERAESMKNIQFINKATVKTSHDKPQLISIDCDTRERISEPPNVVADTENRTIVGLNIGMEYMVMTSEEWIRYDGTNNPTISFADTIVYVRYHGSDIYKPSRSTVLKFETEYFLDISFYYSAQSIKISEYLTEMFYSGGIAISYNDSRLKCVALLNSGKYVYDSSIYDIAINQFERLYISYDNTITYVRFKNGLTTINSFNTSNITSFESTFENCSTLKILDMRKWDMKNVVSTRNMFRSCHGLEEIDMRNVNTSSVLDTSRMFYYCSKFRFFMHNNGFPNSINLSSMFQGCSIIRSLNCNNIITSNATDMSFMFYGCFNLHFLDDEKWDVSNITDMSYAFSETNDVYYFETHNWNIGNLVNCSHMFEYSKLAYFVGDFFKNSAPKLEDASFMFNNSRLREIDLHGFNGSKLVNTKNMFSYNPDLTNLNISNFNASNITDMSEMFRRCTSLTNLDISSFNIPNNSVVTNMLEGINSNSTILVNNAWNKSPSDCGWNGTFTKV